MNQMKIKNTNTFNFIEDHYFDAYTNIGYKFEHNILNKVISPELFGNPVNDVPLRQIERLIEFLVNQVKRIKLQYAFALPKDSKNLN